MKFTGNDNIDKHIKRGLGPMDKVNMDDYWSPHIPFLEHITEVGSKEDIKTMFEENFGIDNLLKYGDEVHLILAKQGYAHDQLAISENPEVRAAVAANCDNPEKFLGDDASEVKIALIKRDIGLEQFSNDDSYWIQREVIQRGYNLESFVHHESPILRQAVAQQGYGLEELSQSSEIRVLEAVARQGYDPERFANHENERVQYAACLAGACPEKFVNHPDAKFRSAVAKNGQYLDILQHDESYGVLYNVIGHNYNLEQFASHPNEEVRHSLAVKVLISHDDELKERIYPLLKDDESDRVREILASDGYYLDQYVTDESGWVRSSVAQNGYGLETLVNDDDEDVLMRVAEQGYGLDRLKDHPSSFVRGMVAAQGYQPEVFVNDPSEEVAEVARPILAELEWERTHEVTLTEDDLNFLTDDSLKL